MTPEFDRQASFVLGSPYWNHFKDDPKDFDRFNERQEAFRSLRDAIQVSNSYDDLSDDLKALWDIAKVEADAEEARLQKIIAEDGDGYGRFLENWDGYRSSQPTTPPTPAAPETPPRCP
jgi:hypothetical protein